MAIEKEICPYCGNIVPHNIKYCVTCGHKLEGVFESRIAKEAASEQKHEQKVPLLKAIIAPIAVVLAVLVSGVIFRVISMHINNASIYYEPDAWVIADDYVMEPEREVVKAIETYNLDTMYILTEDTGLIEIEKAQADEAWITADRRHIVLYKNKNAYYVDTQDISSNIIDSDTPRVMMNSKGEICLSCDIEIRDNGVIMDEMPYGQNYVNRYFWDDDEYVVYETENVSVYSKLIGKDSLNMLFITEKGVYILPEYSGQMIFLSELPENMSTNEADYFDNLEALYINSRYDHAIWSYETNDGSYVAVYKNNDIQIVKTGASKLTQYNYNDAWCISEDGYLFVCESDNKVIYQYGDSDYITFYENGDNLMLGGIYGKCCDFYANGKPLDRCSEEDINDLCISIMDTKVGTHSKLVKAELGCSGEVILEGNQFIISGKHIVWKDDTDRIWFANLDKDITFEREILLTFDTVISKLSKIGSKFAAIEVLESNRVWRTYICKISTGEIKELDSEVSQHRMDNGLDQTDSDKIILCMRESITQNNGSIYIYNFQTEDLNMICDTASDFSLVYCTGQNDNVIYTRHEPDDADYVDELWMNSGGLNEYISMYYTRKMFTKLICDYLHQDMYSNYGFQCIENINVYEDAIYAGGPYKYADSSEEWVTLELVIEDGDWKVAEHYFDEYM